MNQISVVVVTYNSEETIQDCVESLLSQTYNISNIIIWDNHSTDNTLSILDKYKNKIKIISSKENLGFALGNNLAVREIDTTWLALLNPDARADKKWIENLLNYANLHTEFSFFASRMMKDEITLDGAGDSYHISGLCYRKGHGEALQDNYLKACEVFSPCGGAAFYKTEVFKKLGGFDPDYFCYVEDVDLGFRMRLSGERCAYVPEAIVWHKGYGSTKGKNSFTVFWGMRNLILTYFKNMPFPELIFYLPLHFLALIMGFVKHSLTGNFLTVCKSYFSAIIFFPKIIKKRNSPVNKNNALLLMDKKIPKRFLNRK